MSYNPSDDEMEVFYAISDCAKTSSAVVALYDLSYKRGFDEGVSKAKRLYMKELPLMQKVALGGVSFFIGLVIGGLLVMPF